MREKKQKERQAKESSKDLTKYDVTISGETFSALPKRRAIFHVVKGLCDAGVTPEQIHEVLHWRANGLWRVSDGTIDSDDFRERVLKAAVAGGPAFDPGRWFHADDQLIHANGKTYALTKMWGVRTEEAVNDLLTKFKDHDITFQAVKV